MSIALQVEKTSKRGGRIIHEKELMLPPAAPSPPPAALQMKEQPTITEIMKAPSKVVLLRVKFTCIIFVCVVIQKPFSLLEYGWTR